MHCSSRRTGGGHSGGRARCAQPSWEGGGIFECPSARGPAKPARNLHSKLGSRAITTIESAYARSGKISRQNFKYVDFTLKPHTITILNLKFGTSMHPGADGSLWQYYSFSLMSQSDYKKSVALIKALPGAENWKIDIPLASDYIENCKTGSPDEVAYDLGTGMSTDSRDSEGWTPLMVASAYNVKPEVVEVLLKAGSDVNAADTRGRTPLMAAAMTNPNPAVIRALLGSKADLYARDREGLTVLQEATRYQQNPEILGLLIGAGANLDGKAPDGETVLMLAARYNQNPDVVLALLNAVADATARDPDGKTALDYARENSNLEGSEALAALEKATD